MARTATLQPGESLDDFIKRLGITRADITALNPGLTLDSLVEGATLTIPDAVAGTAATQEPTIPATGQALVTAPEGTLPTSVQGLFDEMLKTFASAFETYLSAPAFIKGEPTAIAGREAGKGAGPGWTGQEAAFLRELQPELEQRYGEQVMRKYAETGEIPTLTAAEFLRGIKPRTEMEMRSSGRSEAYGGRTGVPFLGVRKLRV